MHAFGVQACCNSLAATQVLQEAGAVGPEAGVELRNVIAQLQTKKDGRSEVKQGARSSKMMQ
jgi:hypothetical protein